MATDDEARQALIDTIAKLAPKADAQNLMRLAEAWAWITNPAQPHGGGKG